MTKFLTNQTNKNIITQSMLDNLEYDQDMNKSSKLTPTATKETNPLAMLVFHQADIDAAAYHLAKSIDDPTIQSPIRCVFVQESCVNRFSGSLRSKLKTYTKEHIQCSKTNEIVSKLSAKTICPETPSDHFALPLVWNFSQEHFTVDGQILPVVSLFSFRTVKEAMAMVKKESIKKGATIWCENQAMAYEVIANTPLEDFYLNCFGISWKPIEESVKNAQPTALIENSYHYEVLLVAGKQKRVVFPFGTIFAN